MRLVMLSPSPSHTHVFRPRHSRLSAPPLTSFGPRNERFQQLLDAPEGSLEEVGRKFEALEEAGADFVATASRYARVIVSELGLPPTQRSAQLAVRPRPHRPPRTHARTHARTHSTPSYAGTCLRSVPPLNVGGKVLLLLHYYYYYYY